MKKALSGILAALVLLSSLPTAMTASALPSDSDVEDRNVAHTVYVSTTGNDDTGDGSQGKPFATIEKAKEHVRTLDKDSGDIVVKIAGGLYELEDTIVFDENDSGNENCTIYYEAVDGEEPVSSWRVTGRKPQKWIGLTTELRLTRLIWSAMISSERFMSMASAPV